RNLPGETKRVLWPSSFVFAAAGRQPLTIVIDSFLRLAVDHERDSLGERKFRTAVQGSELPAVELEGHDHDAAGGARPGFRVARKVGDAGLREDGGVELRRLLGLVVEPEERGDLG